MHRVGRKVEDARRAAEMLDAAGDLLLLGAQMLGVKTSSRLGIGFVLSLVHEPRELVVRAPRIGAVRQVLGRRRIERLADPFGDIAVEEAIVVQMVSADHGFLRAARAACARRETDGPAPSIRSTRSSC